MKKSTLIGCFIGLLGLTLNAQNPQTSSTTLNGSDKISLQKESSSSLEDLLLRYNKDRKSSGSVSDYYTVEEQQMLRSYLRKQQPNSRNSEPIGSRSTYCIPEGTNSDRFIDNFSTTGGSENISNLDSGFSDGGYADLYDTYTVAQEPDGTVDFSVYIMGEISGFRIWVDWNQDGVFDVSEEVSYASTRYDVTHTGTITVPSDALEGDTRMRIVSHWYDPTGDVDPCETGFTYGEFEDYKFTVTSDGGGSSSLTTAYGINNYTQDLIGFGVATPEDSEVFGTSPITLNFEAAGAIDPANPTIGYTLDSAGQLYSFDVESGFYTLLGEIPGDWVGMEFDSTTGILYGLSGPILYTIDPDNVTATLVGVTGIDIDDIPVALAIDGNSIGYTYDLLNKLLYSIDLATGTATVIGDIGFNANYGQGMAYDPTTDTVYMSAFNSSTFTAEWRSVNLATGATTFIGNMVNESGDAQVAWVSIGQTLAPPTCPRPLNLAVTNIMSTSVDLSWDLEPNASNGYIWYIFQAGANPLTDSPVATGTTPSGTSTVTATDLSGGLVYDFYVVANCDSDGLSQFAGPVTFVTIPVCGGKFYDAGGPLQHYNDRANDTTTISPENAGGVVTVTFIDFNTEWGRDALYVYDGPDANSPIISSGNPATVGGFPAGGYYGDEIPGPFTSTHSSGKLTFVFRSDGSVSYPGWEADVTCTSLGIGENLLEGFSFYPNPTSDILNLNSAEKIESVLFYNVLGQCVIDTRIDATTFPLDTSALRTGIYLMKVTVNGQTATYRVLKN